MLNSVLLTSAQKVINSKSPTQCLITAKFISSADGSTFTFYPLLIDTLTFMCNYADEYSDDITMEMTISPHDYALMQDQGQDLLCVLTITYVDRYGTILYDPDPIVRQYHAIINDAQDIRQIVPDVQSLTEPSLKMSVQLLEETVYNLRNTRINTIYQTMTVKQAIYAIAQNLGIEQIHLVDPDNVHVYDHIEIGSYQGISTVFSYLQSICGVYFKGINYYITRGVLYVYPSYETNPTYDKTAIFYQVDTGRFAGSHVFHRTEDNSVSIVINSQPQVTDLSIKGSENIGTGVIFNRASRSVDGMTTIDSNEGALFTQSSSLAINLANPRTAVGLRNNVKYINGTDNPFPAMSELISHQASMMLVQWPHADPFQFDPCHQIIYYYDQNETMIKKTGMIERAAYQYVRKQKIDAKYMFECSGELMLRLAPNEKQTI